MKVLPCPGTLARADLAPQERRQLAADREAQTGAAVLAARPGIGLLKRFEDEALLLRARCRCRYRETSMATTSGTKGSTG